MGLEKDPPSEVKQITLDDLEGSFVYFCKSLT